MNLVCINIQETQLNYNKANRYYCITKSEKTPTTQQQRNNKQLHGENRKLTPFGYSSVFEYFDKCKTPFSAVLA